MSQSIGSYSENLAIQPDDLQLSGSFCITFAPLVALQVEAPNFLHRTELECLRRFSFAKRQHSYLLGRYAAKQAIRQYNSEISPTSVLIKNGILEHPVAYYPSYEKFQLTLAHSEPFGAALVFPEEYPMGIDIEVIGPHTSSILTQLTPQERQWIEQDTRFSPAILSSLFWTVKEALSKTIRTGIMTPFPVYAIKKASYQTDQWVSEFENFEQYKATSFLLDKYILSMVYPKQTSPNINIRALQQWIKNLDAIKIEQF